MTEAGTRRLDGRTAVVTGASQGIGRAIAVAFAQEGANVVAGGRNAENLSETAKLGGGRILAQACDVRNADEVRAVVQKAIDDFGAIDVMCNNAGVAHQALLVDTSQEMWDETMETNVRGVFFGCKYAIAAMAQIGRGGSIINMASINSFVGEQTSGAYSASKGAVLMLTKNAAAECAEQAIRVNAICPGAVDTPMSQAFVEALGGQEAGHQWWVRYQPLVGLMRPEDIANVAVFLACDESRSMTGSSIVIDGGLMASWDHNVA
jgi:NAD(P)-dependent dehydrogenase (short-subunit alcohol dehydrogenase family)